MALVVLDADVVIGFLSRDDAHHGDAVARVTRALEPGTERQISAVTYAEVLVGPLRAAGDRGAAIVRNALARLDCEVVAVDPTLAEAAAAVRASTGLRLPDAFTVATALRGAVRVESFDRRVVDAFEALRST